jgi:hypothetical protein
VSTAGLGRLRTIFVWRVVDQRFARAKTALRNVVEEAMGAALLER